MPHLGVFVALAFVIQAPEGANVELTILGPDGKPAANREIVLLDPSSQPGPDGDPPPTQGATTDANGRVRAIFNEGLWRLNVRVPGLGFGGTGLFEVRNGFLARPHLPRLAKYARIEGTVAPALRKPGQTIYGWFDLVSRPGPHPNNVSATCDDQGRFVFEEVIPGDLRVTLSAKPGSHWWRIRTEPGQTRRDVVIEPPPALDPREARAMVRRTGRFRRPNKGEQATWAEGTVRDAKGDPVKGATVTIHDADFAEYRSQPETLTDQTDDQGRYSIVGPHWEFSSRFRVSASMPGRTPAIIDARAPGQDDKQAVAPIDLTFPEQGGSLRIRLTFRRQPAAKLSINLAGDHTPPLRIDTDDQGVALIENLFPGEYRLTVYGFIDVNRHMNTAGVTWRVGITAGREVSLNLPLPEAHEPGRFQPLWPDGTVAHLPQVDVHYTQRGPYAITHTECDPEGIGSFQFNERGIEPVRIRFRDLPAQSIGSNEEPYFEGFALVAVSPALSLERPLTVQCHRRSLGAIRAQLVGLDGKPTRGSVLLLEQASIHDERIVRAATTDESGVVEFAGLPSGPYLLRGSIEQSPSAYLPAGSGPLPDDAALRNQVVYAPVEVKVESGQEARATVGPKKVGYLRAKIHPPKDAKPTDIHIWTWPENNPGTPARSRRDPDTGEIIAGPLDPGKVPVYGWRWAGDEKWPIAPKSASIPEGGVAQLVLEPADLVALPPYKPTSSFRPLAGFVGTVYLHDGKTPAFGARAVVIAAGPAQPYARSFSDNAGKLNWNGAAILFDPKAKAPAAKDQITTPTVVVSLPGLTGATIIPLDLRNPKPIRVVLPEPLRATGRVTLAGEPVGEQDAVLRVVAGHRGRAGLDKVLSVEAVVEADGRFALEGLTPGTYQVQAARDGIWLSRSTSLTVEPGKPIPELTLDIPAPGADVTLTLADDRGQPLGRKGLKIERPDGPLASLWPEHLETDPRGQLTIPALEVGTHAVRIDGEDAPRTFDVPDRSQGPAARRFAVPPKPDK